MMASTILRNLQRPIIYNSKHNFISSYKLQRSNSTSTKLLLNNHRTISISNNFLKSAFMIQGGQQNYTTQQSKSKSDCPKHSMDPKPKSLQEKLKKAITEYGSTVIVFHVSISLISLGSCYLLISSGVDVNSLLLKYFNYEGKLGSGAGTFAIAYGIHKLFAPVRIVITLTATPFIVNYLRRIGFIKHVKK